jgi:hypothetical protein
MAIMTKFNIVNMKQRRWIVLVAVLLLTTGLAAQRLNTDPIWYDEYWSIFDAGGAHLGPLSPMGIWQRIAINDAWQAPLYYTALAGWGALVGWTAFAGRVLSLFCGLLAVAWTYHLGRVLASPLAGVCAAVVLGTSAFFVSYLHELRGYTLFALLTVVVISTYWRLVSHPASRPALWMLMLGVAALLYTHVFAILTVGALSIYHLLFVGKTKQWWQVLFFMLMGGLLFLPWAIVLLGPITFTIASGGRTPPNLNAGEILNMMVYAFGNGIAVLSLILLAGLPHLRRNASSRMLWFVGLVILGAALLLNALVPTITHLRYLISLWPLLALAAGMGIAQLARWKWLPAGLLGVLIVAGSLNALNPAFSDYLFRPVFLQWFQPHLPLQVMGTMLKENAVDGDRIGFHSPYYPWARWGVLDYYLHGTPAVYVIIDQLAIVQQRSDYLAALQQFLGGAGRVWVAVEKDVPSTDNLADFQAVLKDDDYTFCAQYLDLPDLRLDLYVRTVVFCTKPGETPATLARFGDGVMLDGLDYHVSVAGKKLSIDSTWSTTNEIPTDTYSIGMYVFDTQNQFVAQTDHKLPVGKFGYDTATINLDKLPAGAYSLRLAVYNWHSGGRLLGAWMQTGETGDNLTIGKFLLP